MAAHSGAVLAGRHCKPAVRQPRQGQATIPTRPHRWHPQASSTVTGSLANQTQPFQPPGSPRAESQAGWAPSCAGAPRCRRPRPPAAAARRRPGQPPGQGGTGNGVWVDGSKPNDAHTAGQEAFRACAVAAPNLRRTSRAATRPLCVNEASRFMAGCDAISSSVCPTARSTMVSRDSCGWAPHVAAVSGGGRRRRAAAAVLGGRRSCDTRIALPPTCASSLQVPRASRLCVVATPASAAPAAANGTAAMHVGSSPRKCRLRKGLPMAARRREKSAT